MTVTTSPVDTGHGSPARGALRRRSQAAGTLGAVAAATPVSAAAGLSVLADGGSCVDAALAAALTETVVLAPKCGLAGDVVALHLRPGADVPDALVSVGAAADGLGAAVRDRGELPATGGLSVGVPGAPDGYAALAGRARMDLARLCAPAAALARRGFAWSVQCAELAAEADELLMTHQPDGCAYRPRSGPLTVGQRVQLPGLADLLDAFARLGPALFTGEAGAAAVARVAAAGGVVQAGDLARPTARWEPAAHLQLTPETSAWTTPGPTYGPALLRVLELAVTAPPAELPGIVARVLRHQAATAGDGTPVAIEGTSVVAATDAEGGAVVVVHSNSFPQFGSGLVVDDWDLVLSNRAGRGFDPDPGRPNFPAPGRRPLTTLHAWALGAGRPTMLGGTPGGVQQVPWNAQVLLALQAGRTAAEAVNGPLWRLDGAATVAEADHPLAGDGVATVDPLSMRSSLVAVAPAGPDGVARSWADPRNDTQALAL